MAAGHGMAPVFILTRSPQSIFAFAKRNDMMETKNEKEGKVTRKSPNDLTLAWIQRPEVLNYFPSIAGEAVRVGLGRHAWTHILDDAEGKWYEDEVGNTAFVRGEEQLMRLVLFKADRTLAAHFVHYIK